MTNTIRIQIKNKGNSKLIAELTAKATLIKRTGIHPPLTRENEHLGRKEVYNSNQGLATFDIDCSLLDLVPNDAHILTEGGRISAKQYKNDNE